MNDNERGCVYNVFVGFGIKYVKAVLKDVVRTGIWGRVMLFLCNDRVRTAAAGGHVQYLHNTWYREHLCLCMCLFMHMIVWWCIAQSFFFTRLRIKFILIKLKAKFSDLFLLLFSKLHHHWGETAALGKITVAECLCYIFLNGGVILKLKKEDLRVYDFYFQFQFFFLQTLSPLTPTMYGFI